MVTALGTLCLPQMVSAQTASATLNGTAVDETGASIPKAQIVIRNVDNGFERRIAADPAGAFSAHFLPPGQYIVQASHDGFANGELRGLVLAVGDRISIEIQLKIQGTNESVTVVAQPIRSSVSSSVGTVVGRQFISNMPLNGHSLQALLQLVPGVVLTSNVNSTATSGNQFSINGQRTVSNYFTVDGVSANTGMDANSSAFFGNPSGAGNTLGTTTLGGTNNIASLDALQEFRIETSTFAPEFGRTPGGQVSLVTRSGTNLFHGSVSEFFRNDAMDANDWFASASGRPKGKEHQNLFGGVLGGPVRRDRAFFFFSYEGLRLVLPKAQQVTVPTLEQRAAASAALQPYLNAYPLPNLPNAANGTGQFIAGYSDPGSFDSTALRADFQPANSMTGFIRYSHAPSSVSSRSLALSTVTSVEASDNSITGGVTWVAGSRLSTDVRVNWTRNRPRYVSDLDTFGGAVVPQVADVFRPGWNPSNSVLNFSFPSTSWVWGVGSANASRQANIVGTAAYAVGSHAFKAGVDYRRMMPLFGGIGSQAETDIFFTAADAAASRMTAYVLSAGDPVPREPIFTNLSFYVQDSWRLGRRLTATYGVRFERVPPPSEAHGRLPRTLLGIESSPPAALQVAPEGTPLWHDRAGEFAPRVGLAYQLVERDVWKATIRGGVGNFYDLGLGDIAASFQFAYPFVATKTRSAETFPVSGQDRTPPALGVDPPSTFYVMDPNLRLPHTRQWNVAIEQTFGAAHTVTVTYVGAVGRDQLAAQQYRSLPLTNWPTPVTLEITAVWRNITKSDYKALQMQYQARVLERLQALASYSLARSRDNASSEHGAIVPMTQSDLLAREFAPSDFDLRHQGSVGLTYDLPAPTRGNTPLRAITVGWGLDLLVRARSAFPVTPIAKTLQIANIVYNVRPDLVPGEPLYLQSDAYPGGRRINPAAFVAPPQSATQGNAGRNSVRGLGASQIDVALRREFRLLRNTRLQFKAELFNALNHPNFGQPSGSIVSGTFGQPSSMLNRSLGGLNALYQMGGPRSGELGIKLLF